MRHQWKAEAGAAGERREAVSKMFVCETRSGRSRRVSSFTSVPGRSVPDYPRPVAPPGTEAVHAGAGERARCMRAVGRTCRRALADLAMRASNGRGDGRWFERGERVDLFPRAGGYLPPTLEKAALGAYEVMSAAPVHDRDGRWVEVRLQRAFLRCVHGRAGWRASPAWHPTRRRDRERRVAVRARREVARRQGGPFHRQLGGLGSVA
jgi:hypothetical protein